MVVAHRIFSWGMWSLVPRPGIKPSPLHWERRPPRKSPFFHFHQGLYWTTYSPFCPTTFCHFSGNLIIPSFQNFFYQFKQKTIPGILFQSSRKWKIFPLREFFKDQNKWISQGATSGDTLDESELPRQAVTVSAWSSKKHSVLHYPNGRLCIFCWLIPDAFHWVLSVGLIGSSTCWNCLVFQKKLII